MQFTLWDILQDIAILGFLMIIGQFLRAKVKLLQNLLMPASLIGGFLGLILGPSVLNILPFSSQLPAYAGILIAIVFACTPIGDDPITKEEMKGIGGFFYQNTGILILQYAFGMVLSLGLLNKFWDLHDSFGLILATGYYGGHGTAVAVGDMFKDMGYNEFFDLGNTSATIGLIGGILIGIAIINWGTRKKYTNYVSSPEELPEEIKKGIIPKEKQKPAGKITVSNMTIDPLVFHLSIALIAAYAGKLASKFINSKISWLQIPVFVLALAFGYVIQFILRKTKTDQYVDRQTMQRISGSATDLLVISAIASLNLGVIKDNFAPLAITFVLGFALNVGWFLLVSKYSSSKDWFERGIMNFGRSNGVVATGVLLNRVVDPDQKSRGLEDTGITDLMNRPIAIALQVLPPLFIGMGGRYPLYTTLAMCAAFIVLTILALVFKWWTPGKMQGNQKK
ncbi:sodium/glutamate symporter [Peptoniphilus stercorisuis]|uniref:ESS family glutamate:Na+ symporter n=1 Tax=Peptoniphilus stercorisuis TaxID=1436965 RepID=A0ABS4KC51_9FIRM|nr:sodium/glutamate symporter [Peptoniphilus stercorisuis]MBP2025358.1 ESS family glutamate:Na+ symporter [Peptoniphilus stercorisuis]